MKRTHLCDMLELLLFRKQDFLLLSGQFNVMAFALINFAHQSSNTYKPCTSYMLALLQNLSQLCPQRCTSGCGGGGMLS